MEGSTPDFTIMRLGECRFPSPVAGVKFVGDDDHVLYHGKLHEIRTYIDAGTEPPCFEMAGPRERIYFDSTTVKCGIVTCGGLCPGLNDVIRSIVMNLYDHYSVQMVYGFPYGYEGLTNRFGNTPIELTPEVVAGIHDRGGTILGSSRGHQDISEMVDRLEEMEISILFTIGGDGTLRGAQAITEEVDRRGLEIAVIGIPKTIDNDISYVETSFGFDTAGSEARRVIYGAHIEADGARNGVGLVKLMGRESGFIAAYAALADNDVNFCLVPEVPFTFEGFIKALRDRLEKGGHAVIVVGEGAGQDLMEEALGKDASGNVRFGDIGILLRDRIKAHFEREKIELNLKYIDPSYTIRSMPANARDSAFCLLLGQNAVHAGMAGRTNMVVGYWKNQFTHVPIQLAVSKRKKIDTESWLWSSVLTATGQPRDMG
jgi:6-phosphofructokinase 1